MKVSVVGLVSLSLCLSLSPFVAEAHGDPVMEQALSEHNRYREMENECIPPERRIPMLTWNETLACYARDYAQKRKGDCAMVHSNVDNPNLCYGENLAMGWNDYDVGDACWNWYDEKKDFCYDTVTCTPGKPCGHYLAMVWNTTLQVGCACTKCDNGANYVICNYWPPGNYVGEKPY